MAADTIFVGVPVWRASAFLAETIESVLAQQYRDFRLLLSIDGGDGESDALCARYLGDPRVRMLVQEKHLGWVGNTAFLFAAAAAAGAEFACIQPHDDLIAPQYLSTLLGEAKATPSASVVYCDLEMFGSKRGVVRQASVTGSPFDRMLSLLCDHYSAVAYRGLTRMSAIRKIAPIDNNAYGDFAVDTLWMTRLARAGDLLRVPLLLYRKRMHRANTHTRWSAWRDKRKIAAWKFHCLDMLAEALRVTDVAAERGRLLTAARGRLLALGAPISPYRETILSLSKPARRRLLREFDDAVTGTSGDLPPVMTV